jgi:hypothetical protein
MDIINIMNLNEEFEIINKNYNVYIFYLLVYLFFLFLLKTYLNRLLYNDYLKLRKKNLVDNIPHPNNIHIDLINGENCCHYIVYEFPENISKQIVYCNKCHTIF